MTKFTTYKCGPYTFKSYFKPVGQGYEVGFTYKGQSYFTSNFVHKTEAMTWWKKFNMEIMTFAKKFEPSNKMPLTWYCNFMANNLYKCYYTWLDMVFAKHETTFKKAFSKDFKRYASMKKHAPKTATRYYFKAA